jgi:hypothetical protein
MAAVLEFVNAVRDPNAWVEELNDKSQKVGGLLDRTTGAEVEEALRRLAALFPRVRPVATGLVSLNCGSLVERGGDPEIAGPALLDLLPRILGATADFYTRCRTRVEADPEVAAEVESRAREEDYDINSYIADHPWEELAERFGPELFQEAPISVLAHMAEEFYCLGVIAHLSRSKELRAVARSRPELLRLSEEVNAASGRGSFMTDMLRVLDDERLVVIHPGEQKGFEVRIGGIADNFQLHTLLAGELIGDPDQGRLTGERPDPAVVELARGGAVRGQLHTTGSFNLWNWPGLQPDGTLPQGQTQGNEFWVWNEGTPADIMPFGDVRVVLLGPSAYERHWNAGRRFPNMTAEFVIEQVMAPDAVRDWLARIAAAPRPAA